PGELGPGAWSDPRIPRRVFQAELLEGGQAEDARVASPAREPLGGRVVATVGEPEVDPQLAPSEDDLLFREGQERGVDPELPSTLDPRPGRQVGQGLERP